MTKISPSGVLLGALAAQGVSYILGFAFAIACFVVYSSSALVALPEYPSSIAITLSLGLIATAAGGCVATLVGARTTGDATGSGVVTLLISLTFLYAIDFRYAIDHRWMLVMSLIFTVPAAYLGGRLCIMTHNPPPRSIDQLRG